MPADMQRINNDTYVLRFSGTVLLAEFAKVQRTLSSDINAGTKPRVLATLENFEGWEKGADWGELDFLFAHGNDIDKIAIVGEPSWEGQAMAFAGAGFRRAPVKFFASSDLAAARAWLAE